MSHYQLSHHNCPVRNYSIERLFGTAIHLVILPPHIPLGGWYTVVLLEIIFCLIMDSEVLLINFSSIKIDKRRNVWMGSGCGSVGRASDTRGPWFDSSHWQNINWTFVYLFTFNCIEKTKINKKRPGMAHFLKKNSISRNSFPSIFHQRWPSWLIGQIVHTGLQFESHQLMC